MTTTASFTRLASTTASTKRVPVIVDGKAGAPATSISSLKCTPPAPVSNTLEWRETLQIKTLVSLLQTFVQGDLDIVAGDTLIIGSKEYPIRFVSSLPFGRFDTRRQLIIEDLKR